MVSLQLFGPWCKHWKDAFQLKSYLIGPDLLFKKNICTLKWQLSHFFKEVCCSCSVCFRFYCALAIVFTMYLFSAIVQEHWCLSERWHFSATCSLMLLLLFKMFIRSKRHFTLFFVHHSMRTNLWYWYCSKDMLHCTVWSKLYYWGLLEGSTKNHRRRTTTFNLLKC